MSVGDGVHKDSVEATKLVSAATNQGHSSGQYNLGLAYSTGDGVPKDTYMAYIWLYLSAAQGNQEAVVHRDSISKQLTAEKIQAAQEEAKKWKPKIIVEAL